MRVQISGHSSVQSSSTFGSRKARKPIYILRFKKIEQGQLLYPKIFPLMFSKVFPYMVGHKPLPKKNKFFEDEQNVFRLAFWTNTLIGHPKSFDQAWFTSLRLPYTNSAISFFIPGHQNNFFKSHFRGTRMNAHPTALSFL